MKPATDENIERALGELLANLDTERELLQLVLYDHPLDAPGFFIVRAWYVGKELRPGPGFGFRKLEDALLWIQHVFPYLTRIERMPGDEPQIIAVWT